MQVQKLTFMMEKPPPSTCSLAMALVTSSSVMGSALDPLLLCRGNLLECYTMKANKDYNTISRDCCGAHFLQRANHAVEV